MDKKRVLVVPCDTTASGWYRMIEVYGNIISDIEFYFNPNQELVTEHAMQYDAIILQRPCMGRIDEFIKHFQSGGKKVIVETDDDLLNIPVNNPMHDFMKPLRNTYLRCLRLADAIHVSTQVLKDGLGMHFYDKTYVFENAINLNKYQPKGEGKYITWAGGTSHKDSLDIIKPVIFELVRMKENVLLAGNKEWLNSLGFAENEYLTVAPWKPFLEQHHLHRHTKLNLAPLEVTKFNSAKSNLRILEAAVYGIPSIASDIAPYKKFSDLNDGCVIVKNKFADWMKAIEKLKDENFYRAKSEASLKTVQEYYDLKDVNKKRDEFWRNLLFN